MPAGSKPGERRGGRQKGTPNSASAPVRAACERLKVDPYEAAAMIAANNLPCGVCRGTGKTKYQAGGGDKPAVRTCQSCWGSKLERIDPKTRLDAAKYLGEFLAPKRKAIELSGEEGGPVELVVRWEGD